MEDVGNRGFDVVRLFKNKAIDECRRTECGDKPEFSSAVLQHLTSLHDLGERSPDVVHQGTGDDVKHQHTGKSNPTMDVGFTPPPWRSETY